MSARVLAYYDDRYVTGQYGEPRPNGRIHEGTDLSHSTRPGTAPVVALLDGRVTAVWRPSSGHGYGHRIDTETQWGQVSYAHLHAASPYRVGSTIAQGATVGLEGTSGWTSGPCCHVEHAVNGRKRDARPLIRDVRTYLTAAALANSGTSTPIVVPTTTQQEEPVNYIRIKGKVGARRGGTFAVFSDGKGGYDAVFVGGGGPSNLGTVSEEAQIEALQKKIRGLA
ncbi:M23 family metallopeptidase [Microbacterium sp. dk485]|uniref:M23 family metallopeptidase n=1 Tax=Microbacterium sp. dk485 TaxID=2560021 RepID=UPI0010747860|nr:peptidoglycan DD-metalloendopeptidase family protein [Microbacterium sp. dk485]TFV82047.1 M23 family metallopeptidase [Microbacterium sp. dk485]